MAVVADRWRLGERLGRGAVAEVFDATDVRTGEVAAVKILAGNGPDDDQRFVREIGVLRSLSHPGVVGILDHGVDPEVGAYIALERADGGSLDRLLADGPLAPERVAAIGADLADALAEAHRLGIVHRDVKPSNVLLDGDGRPRLTDFGVARVSGAATITASGWCVGTPAYLAPEQARGESAGPAADVYSLGLVLLEAATGEPAYPELGMPAMLARVERPPVLPPALPPRLRAALAAMTALDPADRPSAAEAAALLRATTADGETGVVPVVSTATTAFVPAPLPPPEPAREPSAGPGLAPPIAVGPVAGAARRRAWATAAAIAGAVLLLVTSIRLLPDGDGTPPAGADPSTAVTTPATAPPTTTPPTPVPPPTTEAPARGHGGGHGHGHGHHDD
jgi:serine/threonine protein kinase